MAVQSGSISSQPQAGTLTGGELLPLDQDIGSPVAATALMVNQGYRIVSLGNTNWQTVGAGASAAVGTVFSCEAVGTGTGTAQRVDCRRVTAQTLAGLAGVAAAILAHSQAEDPHSVYTTAQELSSALQSYLTTSAAAQAYQPLDSDLTNLAAVANQTAFGRAFLALVDQAGARDYIGLGPDDTAALTGLTLTGLAILPHIHGNLAGAVYAHVKNVSGGALAAGTPLRATGTVGDTTTLQVVAASASSAGTMPALFVLSEALANNAEGHATLLGEITGLNTAGLTPGAPLFVPSGGGVLTATRPAANAQQMATVGRAHATTGSAHVLPWPVLGTAAAAAIEDFATAAQGILASTAVQPGALASVLASYALASSLAAVATSGAYADLSGRPTLLALGSATPAALAATASAGSGSTAAPIDHAHQRDTTLVVIALSGALSDPVAAQTVDRWIPTVGGTIIGAALDCETAVSGAAFIVNTRLNSSSIFSTKPQINVGGTTTSNTPVLSTTTFSAGDVFRFDIDQASGGARLAKLTLTIRRSS